MTSKENRNHWPIGLVVIFLGALMLFTAYEGRKQLFAASTNVNGANSIDNYPVLKPVWNIHKGTGAVNVARVAAACSSTFLGLGLVGFVFALLGIWMIIPGKRRD